MFYEQLEKLCKLYKTSPSAVVQELGMSKGTMSNWKKGGIPNGDAVVRFAEHFKVSTDFLLLGVDTFSNSDIDPDLLTLLAQLPKEKQIELRGYVRRMVEESKEAASQEPKAG